MVSMIVPQASHVHCIWEARQRNPGGAGSVNIFVHLARNTHRTHLGGHTTEPEGGEGARLLRAG